METLKDQVKQLESGDAASHVDRKSRGPEVTWTGSLVDRKSRGPEVTWTGSHVDRKSRGPEVTWTGSHVDRKSRGPEVTWTGSHAHRAHRSQIVATISLFTVIRPTPIATCPILGHPSQGSGKKHCALRLPG